MYNFDQNSIYIYSAPKSTDVIFLNLEGKFWLDDVAKLFLALGSADVIFSSFGVRKYNVCEQAN
jgi:hypothetical protein